MKVSNLIKFSYIVFSAVILLSFFSFISFSKKQNKEEKYELYGKPNSPYSLLMYDCIEKYSKKYNIPKYVAYNVAYKETGYRGPFHWNYQPVHISSAGAVGPMQIIPMYAHAFAGKRVSSNELMKNIELNVKVSMKMLRSWYNMHGNWLEACGAYNSGRPIHNDYAIFCSSNKNYKLNWIRY
jgi:soluble lytic murein transglycosylase-like protein